MALENIRESFLCRRNRFSREFQRLRAGRSRMSQYDDTLMAMVRQHKDEMDFLNSVFAFLQRRTQCFNGPMVTKLSHSCSRADRARVVLQRWAVGSCCSG